MAPRKIAVTGAAGYLGKALCGRLQAESGIDRIVALDRRIDPTTSSTTHTAVQRCDVNDPALVHHLEGLDAVCHLAFVLDSQAPDEEAQATNLRGTEALLEACIQAGVRRVVVASSVSAYGALPDNPERLLESDPLRARDDFRYAFHKRLVEERLWSFGAMHPEIALVSLRLALVLGPPPRPGAASDLLRWPVLMLPLAFRAQLVHVDDAVEAFVGALAPHAMGAYNIATNPALDGPAIASVTGQRFVPLPASWLAAASAVAHGLGVREAGRLDFLRHSIVVECGRAERELGWRPRHDAGLCLAALRG